MNVIIEGPNGAGKSTLADYIKNLLKFDQVNLHHKKGPQYRRYLAEYARDQTVFVRAHWSEIVYSELFGREKPFTPKERESLGLASCVDTVTVLCLPSLAVMKQRHQQRVSSVIADSLQEKPDELKKERALWAAIEMPHLLVYESRDMDELARVGARVASVASGRPLSDHFANGDYRWNRKDSGSVCTECGAWYNKNTRGGQHTPQCSANW